MFRVLQHPFLCTSESFEQSTMYCMNVHTFTTEHTDFLLSHTFKGSQHTSVKCVNTAACFFLFVRDIRYDISQIRNGNQCFWIYRINIFFICISKRTSDSMFYFNSFINCLLIYSIIYLHYFEIKKVLKYELLFLNVPLPK